MAELPFLLSGLVDDAALFPPGNAPMDRAVVDHRAYRTGPYASLLGRFLCPASRLGELRAELVDGDRIAVGLIVDVGLDGLPAALAEIASEPRLVLALVEMAVPADLEMVAGAHAVLDALPAVTSYVELPRVDGWREALAVVAEVDADVVRGAKLRTGGLVASAFPTEREVAEFIVACTELGVPFKCTAGLHNALRHTATETGFEHHGFLNILLAAELAAGGSDVDAVEKVLAERDPAVLAAQFVARADRPRSLFASYGSCSFGEPIEDLVALGLIEDADAE